MAMRAGVLRRFFSTSIFSSQTTAAAASNAKPAPVPSTTVFISGLNKRTTSEKLHEEASKFGEVVHAKVVTDGSSGFSKGYGFVKYATIAQAEQGIKGLDARFLDGWVILAEFAHTRTAPGHFAFPKDDTHQAHQAEKN